MRFIPLVTALSVVLFSLACGGEDSGGASVGGTAGAAGNAQGGHTQAGAAGSAQGGSAGQGQGGNASTLSAGLEGKLLDDDAKTLEDYRVQLCYHACRMANTEADGTYAFSSVEAATHLLEIWPSSGGSNASVWLSPTFPVTLQADKTAHLNLTWLAPDKRVTVPAVATELEIADGLFVSLGHDTSTPSMYLSDDFKEVYGVRVPDGKIPPIVGEGPGVPVAMWILGPVDTEAKAAPFPVRFANIGSKADGKTLHVWMSHQDETSLEGTWETVGEVTVSGNEMTGTAKLPRLGTVLLSE